MPVVLCFYSDFYSDFLSQISVLTWRQGLSEVSTFKRARSWADSGSFSALNCCKLVVKEETQVLFFLL